MDKLAHFINHLLDWINAVPSYDWFLFGLAVASWPITALVVEWYKRHHFKVHAQELTNVAINFLVVVSGTVMTLSDWLIAHGLNVKQAIDQFGHFLPFGVPTLLSIIAFAPHLYDISKAINTALINKDSETQSDRLKAVLSAADGVTQQASGTTHAITASFGTESAGVDKSGLIQL